MNALRNGLTEQHITLCVEMQEDCRRSHGDLMRVRQRKGATEAQLCTRAILCAWRPRRATAIDTVYIRGKVTTSQSNRPTRGASHARFGARCSNLQHRQARRREDD
jgi:hypothetical protein